MQDCVFAALGNVLYLTLQCISFSIHFFSELPHSKGVESYYLMPDSAIPGRWHAVMSLGDRLGSGLFILSAFNLFSRPLWLGPHLKGFRTYPSCLCNLKVVNNCYYLLMISIQSYLDSMTDG